MLAVQRIEAIRLRKESGTPIREISEKVGASVSSVKRWVRDIRLDKSQIRRLQQRGPDKIRQAALIRRAEFRKKGADKIKLLDPLYVAGVMLYWGEGTKNRHQLAMTNSDPAMLRLFIRFIRKFYSKSYRDLSVYIHCYTDVHSLPDIEKHWLKELSLPNSCLRKTIINKKPLNSSLKRTGFLPYGVCRICINDVSVIQEIFGAIQEYCGEEIESLSVVK